MRRIDELMRNLGFNKDAPVDTQKAFVRHLIRAANETSPQNLTPSPKQSAPEAQLSFDPEVLGTRPTEPAKKKISSDR